MVHGLLSSCGGQAQYLRHWLSCPAACKILVPQLWIKLASPALEAEFLATRPPGKSLCMFFFFFFMLYLIIQQPGDFGNVGMSHFKIKYNLKSSFLVSLAILQVLKNLI